MARRPPVATATICGSIARRLLHDGGNGRVVAVFERSFYIQSDDGVACIGNESLPPCPLNVITDACRDGDWRVAGLRAGTPWTISASTIRAGHAFRIRMGDVQTWQPAIALSQWHYRALNHALSALGALAATRVPGEGLGVFALRPGKTATEPVARMASEPLEHLHRWLKSSIRGDITTSSDGLERVRPLLGLGPGLTPSGDDLLGGVMVALHTFGREEISNALWRTLRPWALQAGNVISFAHLSAASEGQGSAAVHGIVHALQTGNGTEMVECLSDIEQTGHTSGWDALAGVVTVVDALLCTEGERDDTTTPHVVA